MSLKNITKLNAMDFINDAIDKFPFKIKMIRTDKRSKCQTNFHSHCEHIGLHPIYIKLTAC